MLKRNTTQPKPFGSKEGAITGKKESIIIGIIGKETNFHHFCISLLIPSYRENPSFNFLLIPKEAAKATTIPTHFC